MPSSLQPIETTSGAVRGYLDRGGVRICKGIPYGEAPAGPLRFLPPRPYRPRPGVLEATECGPIAPQLSRTPEPQGEDCLVLNVWTPAPDDARRPVMVYIHGGGFRTGSGGNSSCDGSNLARTDDVVVVTLNHRLGPLGYLYLGDVLGGEYEPANAGNLDLVRALEWVRDNIGSFGGDPGCVTVYGMSGGGKMTSHLLAMPAAEGLFHRAIIQSGALSTALERDAATAYTHRFLDRLGLRTGEAHKLLDWPVEPLLNTAAALSRDGADPEGGYGGGGGPQPLVDGITLPMHPGAAVARGASADVPVMIGSTLDESIGAYLGHKDKFLALTWQNARAALASNRYVDLGDRADEVIDHYRHLWPDIPPAQLVARVEAAGSWRLLSNRLADYKAAGGRAPVWMYVMTFQAGDPEGVRGAGHGADVPLLMRNIGHPDEIYDARWFADAPGSARFSDIMAKTWVAIARNGDPANPLVPEWPAYTPEDRTTMLLDLESEATKDPFGDSVVFPSQV